MGPHTISNKEGAYPAQRFLKPTKLKFHPKISILYILIRLFTECRVNIMLDWREREHEDVDLAAINHQPSIDALKACGLYKFWAIPGMRAQVDFLQWLVDRWSIQD